MAGEDNRPPEVRWQHLQGIDRRGYTCGYCGRDVGPDRGYLADDRVNRIYVCSFCTKPSYFTDDAQVPGVAYGEEVGHLPGDVAGLYREARNCMSVSSSTGAVLLCRKLLMHVAVAQGAPEGRSFIEYVEYLAAQGYVPPNGRVWVDHIRRKGNEANHEIRQMTRNDAEELLTFLGMLLTFVYEFPGRLAAPGSSATT